MSVGCQITGEWRNLLAQDDAVRSVQGGPGLLQAFVNSPGTGCTTLLDQTRIQVAAQFGGRFDGFSAYSSYVQALLNNPNSMFLGLSVNDVAAADASGNDVNGVINQIVGLYQGLAEDQVNRVRSNLVNLVTSANSNHDTWQSTTNFCQSTLQAADNTIYVYICWSAVRLIVRDGKNASDETIYSVTRNRLRFNTEKWAEVAAPTLSSHLLLVSDWLNANAGPNFASLEAPPPPLPCLTRVPSLADAVHHGPPAEYWSHFEWTDFDVETRRAWTALGWQSSNWDRGRGALPASCSKSWTALTPQERQAATQLGYDEADWNQPNVAEAQRMGEPDAYWQRFAWAQLSPRIQALWARLGASPATGRAGGWFQQSVRGRPWSELGPAERQAAIELGYGPMRWTP